MAIDTADQRPIWGYEGTLSTVAASTAGDTSLSPQARALYFNTAGTVKVRMLDGTTPTFTGVAGALLPIQFDTIKQSTAATSFLCLY